MSDKTLQNIKDIEKVKNNVLNKTLIKSIFLKDYRKAYVYKKTEKLCKAVHLVLAHAPRTTEVTDKILSLSTGLIGEVLELSSDTSRTFTPAHKSILEIISLLEVAEQLQLIGPKNTSLLIKEYGNVLATLSEELPYDSVIPLDVSVDETSIRGAQRKASVRQTGSKKTPIKRHGVIKDTRKEKVLAILRDKKQATLKDISLVISDCSTKTIQRLLNEMIESGLIKKRGERRWSTYHIVE